MQGSPAQRHMVLTHLQLLDRLPSFADDQPHFRGRDQKLLDCAVAIHIVVKARPIPTSVHDLPQEPFGLSLGGRKITRELALNGCLRCSGKGDGARENTKESRQPSIQLQLLPHNLGGLNQPPCYRTAIQKQHIAQHSTSSHVESQEAGTVRPHPLMSARPLHLLASSQCPASYLQCQQLCFVLCPPLFPNPAQPSQGDTQHTC